MQCSTVVKLFCQQAKLLGASKVATSVFLLSSCGFRQGTWGPTELSHISTAEKTSLCWWKMHTNLVQFLESLRRVFSVSQHLGQVLRGQNGFLNKTYKSIQTWCGPLSASLQEENGTPVSSLTVPLYFLRKRTLKWTNFLFWSSSSCCLLSHFGIPRTQSSLCQVGLSSTPVISSFFLSRNIDTRGKQND